MVNPKGSMYGIFTYIWLIFMVHVGKYTSPMDPVGMISSQKRWLDIYLPPTLYVLPRIRVVCLSIGRQYEGLGITLKLTASSHLKIGNLHQFPKGNSYSKHPFSGANWLLVSGRVFDEAMECLKNLANPILAKQT